ncbi:MAG: RNA polymerase sigma factor [Lachnospiraceae bacterium]
MIRAYDAEDICQDVFLKLLSENYHFDSPTHEKAWIIRTTINACKDHLRTAFWKRAIDLDNASEIPEPNKQESEILDLVMTLPKNYRVSIYLYYYEGYQVNEIAAMLGKSENTVSAYLSRGRKKLKSVLDENQKQANTNSKGVMPYVQRF